jgi:hypothetical protein
MRKFITSWSNDNTPPCEIVSCFFLECGNEATTYPIVYIGYGNQGGAGVSNFHVYGNTFIQHNANDVINVDAAANAAVDIKNNLIIAGGVCLADQAPSCTCATNITTDATGSITGASRADCLFLGDSTNGTAIGIPDPRILSGSIADHNENAGTDLGESYNYDIHQNARTNWDIGCSVTDDASNSRIRGELRTVLS